MVYEERFSTLFTDDEKMEKDEESEDELSDDEGSDDDKGENFNDEFDEE